MVKGILRFVIRRRDFFLDSQKVEGYDKVFRLYERYELLSMLAYPAIYNLAYWRILSDVEIPNIICKPIK